MTAKPDPDPVHRKSKISVSVIPDLLPRLLLRQDRGLTHITANSQSVLFCGGKQKEIAEQNGFGYVESTWKREPMASEDRTRMQEPAHKGTPEV